MPPSISVVIPVYNRFDYLSQAIGSVFEQTQLPNEIIIVDDCSTNSLSDHFAKFPPPGEIKIIRTDRNRRVAGARNWGWRHAKGELITFLDSDDLWEPHKTRVQLDFLEANPGLDGVYGAMEAFWPDGRTEIWANNRPPTVETKTALIDCNITVQTLMIRRTALELLNGFDERFGILDDQDIAIRIGESGRKISFFAEPTVARHRRHNTNYSDHSWLYLAEECRIISENRHRCNAIYGPGSERVHLGRAIRRFAHTTRLWRIPALVLARLLYATAPSSKMPRELWTVPVMNIAPDQAANP
jgi:glycosyltransferase involved in cell wall biosynthesis